MSETAEPLQPPVIPLTDPDAVPVRIINGIAHMGYLGSLVDLLLVTTFPGLDLKGDLQVQRAIAARLRFDLDFARTLHAQLGQMIESLSAPPTDKVN